MTVAYKLSPQLIDSSAKQIARHEGNVLHVYLDSEGFETVGIGHLLTADDPWQLGDTITQEESKLLFRNDWKRSAKECISFFSDKGCWDNLTDTRKKVLINMTFNLGITRLSKFKRMISALKTSSFLDASIEMEDSRWFRQVKSRGVELVRNMKYGTT